MLTLTKPSEDEVKLFLSRQSNQPFSYREVGASANSLPEAYTIDHNRIELGRGPTAFHSAVTAVNNWTMFNLGWIKIFSPDSAIKGGLTVAILVKHYGFWSLNAARVIYIIEDHGLLERHGFAYGTLDEHMERGEERFCVEWHRDDNSVWYDLLAFSRPNGFLSKIGQPLGRLLQARFAKDSMWAMRDAVSGKDV